MTSNTINRQTLSLTLSTTSAALISVLLTLASPAFAEELPYDELRCDAYHTIANYDRFDCEQRCIRSDGGVNDRCKERCEQRYLRELRRANRQHDCQHNACDPSLSDREVTICFVRADVCIAKCGMPGADSQCQSRCVARLDSELALLCDRAVADFCSDDVLSAVCTSVISR